MRDLVITAVVFGFLLLVFTRPHIGVLLWAWISMMNPHRLAYGFAHDFPFGMIIALTTLGILPFTRRRQPIPWNSVSILFFAFVIWMCITTVFAKGDPTEVYEAWVRMAKIHLMLIVTLVLITDREKLDQLIWVMVISLGFYGLKGGIWTVLTGGQDRVWGPPGGVIEGNNELALALVMVAPLMTYLLFITKRKLVRYGLWAMIIACGFSILGSHSRGAFLAASAGVVYLGWQSGRKVLVTALLIVGFIGMVLFMPDHWTQRMDTIYHYETESSAMIRITVWGIIWDMVLDHPFLGMGIMFHTWTGYIQKVPLGTAAHSVYLQALGEHGFVGLFLFLMLMLVSWIRAGRIAAQCRALKEMEWAEKLMSMVQVSLIGFGVGGMFLGLLHFDLPYYLIAVVVLTQEIVKAKIRTSTAEGRSGVKAPVFRSEPRSNVAS